MVHLERDAPACPWCREPIPSEALSCPGCGRQTAGDTMRVPVLEQPGPLPAPRRADPDAAGLRPGAALGLPLFAALILLLGALVVAAVLGQWLVSLLLVPVVLTIGVAVAMTAWGDIEEPVDRAMARATEQLWAGARVARVSVASWSKASRAEAVLRARRRRLRARHERLLRDLGEAVYFGDASRIRVAHDAALASGAEIEQCTTALTATRSHAGNRVQAEREATAPTEAFTVPGNAHERGQFGGAGRES